jgi:chromosome segregation ATPase
MKPKERKELAESFSGVDRILYDRLEKKTGTLQENAGMVVFASLSATVMGILPLTGTVVAPALNTIDNLKIELEKHFSVDEVKEIIAESQKEHNKVIEGAKNYIIRMTEEQERLEKSKQEAIEAGKKEANEKLSEQAKESKEKINNLTNDLTKEKSKASSKIAQLETEKSELITEISRHQEREKNLNEQISSSNQEKEAISKEINRQRQEISNLKEELTNYELAKTRIIPSHLASIETLKIDELREKSKEIELERQNISREYEKAVIKIEAKEKNILNLQEKISE